MKKYFAAFTATALISVAPFALAASSTDLTVTGTITPSACTPSFTNGGTVDYGTLKVSELNQTDWTTLPRSTQPLNVACEAPTAFALHVIDNRPGTGTQGYFGMGLTPQDEKLGHFVPWIFNVVADGVTAKSILSINQGTSWSNAAYLAPNQYLSVSSTTDTTPLAAENVSMDVEIRGWIARADGLTLNEDVAIDGSVTFEMKYL